MQKKQVFYKILMFIFTGVLLLSVYQIREENTVYTDEINSIPQTINLSDHSPMEREVFVESKYPNINIESLVEQNEEYQYAVHYPSTAIMTVDKFIVNQVMQRVQLFEQEVFMQERRREERWPYDMNVAFEIEYYSDNYLSMVFSESKFLGGANYIDNMFTVNVDVINGKILSFSDIFRDNSDYLQRLSKISFAKLNDREVYTNLFDEKWITEGTAPTTDNFQNFTLTEEYLVLRFKEYQVGPQAVGKISIPVLYTEIVDILDEDFRKRMYIDEQPQVVNDTQETNTDFWDIELREEAERVEKAPAKKIALTFDDGPHSTNTGLILDELKERGAKATFFVLGNRVEFYPEVIQRIVDEGHELGNHTWNHPQLPRLSNAEIREQIMKAEEVIFNIAAVRPAVFRPPYGSYDQVVQEIAGKPIILWSIDTQDWKHKNSQKIINTVVNEARDGSIVLFHDLFKPTAESIGMILDELQAQGYEFVTISEMFGFDDDSITKEAGKVFK